MSIAHSCSPASSSKTHARKRLPFQTLALCALSMYLLFKGFYTNAWRVAADDWFRSHQRDTESLVLGRIVATRQQGMFSHGGLTGWGNTESCPEGSCIGYPQYEAFLQDKPFTQFAPYLSQTGGQAMVLGLLDQGLSIPSAAKLDLFHRLTSLLAALALTLVVLWFSLEFGLTAGLFVLVSAVLSQWLTVFGRNLWWSIWAFYLPMLSLAFYLRGLTARPRWLALGGVVFPAILLKCTINGYEYITTTIVMMLMPLVYYGLARTWGLRSLSVGLLVAGAASLMAVLVSVAVLSVQIAAVTGTLADGPAHILYSLAKRTYSDPALFPSEYRKSLQAGVWEVLLPYLRGTFFNLNNWWIVPSAFVTRFLFKIRYLYLIGLFFGAGLLLARLHRRTPPSRSRQTDLALVWTTWLSILAPLSWLVLFKAHSSIHTHMNFLVWQMPYTLFGFALTGIAIQRVANAWWSGLKSARLVRRHPGGHGEESESATAISAPALETQPGKENPAVGIGTQQDHARHHRDEQGWPRKQGQPPPLVLVVAARPRLRHPARHPPHVVLVPIMAFQTSRPPQPAFRLGLRPTPALLPGRPA